MQLRFCCAREVQILLGVHQSSLSFRSFFLFAFVFRELLRSLGGASFQKCGLHPVTSLFSRFKVSFTRNLFSGTRNPSTFKFFIFEGGKQNIENPSRLVLHFITKKLEPLAPWWGSTNPPTEGSSRIFLEGGMPHRKDPNPRKTEGQST